MLKWSKFHLEEVLSHNSSDCCPISSFFPLMHSKTSLFFPSTSLSSHPHLCVPLICLFVPCCMPRLRETRLQIQERTAREIRHRTAARIAALLWEAEDRRQAGEDATVEYNIVQEDTAEGGIPRQCERSRRFDSFCYRLCCVLLFLFFALFVYNANKIRQTV